MRRDDTLDMDETRLLTLLLKLTLHGHAAVTLIKVVNIGTEDEENIVSTIENVAGGFGSDTLTGDDRSQHA